MASVPWWLNLIHVSTHSYVGLRECELPLLSCNRLGCMPDRIATQTRALSLQDTRYSNPPISHAHASQHVCIVLHLYVFTSLEPIYETVHVCAFFVLKFVYLRIVAPGPPLFSLTVQPLVLFPSPANQVFVETVLKVTRKKTLNFLFNLLCNWRYIYLLDYAPHIARGGRHVYFDIYRLLMSPFFGL